MRLTWKRFVIVWIVTWLCTWLGMALAVLSYGVYRMRSTMNGIADKLAPFKFSISNENGTVKKIRRSDTVFLDIHGLEILGEFFEAFLSSCFGARSVAGFPTLAFPYPFGNRRRGYKMKHWLYVSAIRGRMTEYYLLPCSKRSDVLMVVDSFSGSIPIAHAMEGQSFKQPRDDIGFIRG